MTLIQAYSVKVKFLAGKVQKFVSSQYLLDYDKQAEILQVCMKVNTDHTMCKTCIQVP